MTTQDGMNAATPSQISGPFNFEADLPAVDDMTDRDVRLLVASIKATRFERYLERITAAAYWVGDLAHEIRRWNQEQRVDAHALEDDR